MLEVGVDAAPVAREESGAPTEVALYLRGTRLVPEYLLHYRCQVRETLATCLFPPRQNCTGVQLQNSSGAGGRKGGRGRKGRNEDEIKI